MSPPDRPMGEYGSAQHALRVRQYPLDAVRDSERWKLEALQSRLAAAMADRLTSSERHGRLISALSAAAAAATATNGSVIDPVSAGRHLRHVDALRSALAVATRAAEAADAACNQLRHAVGAQQVRLESIERHRRDFLCRESREAERLKGIEDEHAWLARSVWRSRPAGNSERLSAASARVREGGRS